ncbi:MAG: GntR family transcriptional regulator [Bacteroidaceae bacterium]
MNFKDTRPIYQQIAERIHDEIMLEYYQEDERIPSVREYAAIVEVNVNTIVKAYDYLSSIGLIYNRRGMGYYVSIGAREQIAAIRREEFMKNTLPTLFNEMKVLNISMEEIIKKWAETSKTNDGSTQ